MDEDQTWSAIDYLRTRTADMLESLTADEWLQPSLCAGWTVRDVAAHLTLQEARLGDILRSVIKHPGGLNRMIRDVARERAAIPTEQIIAEIRGMIGSRRHNFGVTRMETLIDALVHEQDIAVPLGRDVAMPVDAAAAAATRVWDCRGGSKSKVFQKVPLDGLRLTATDTSWSVGDGRDVEGPISAILLLLTGRTATAHRLSGLIQAGP